MTPADRRSHLETLRELTVPGGPIDADAPTATHRQPSNVTVGRRTKRLVLTPARRRLHSQILDEYFSESPDVLRDRRALITAGPPGAGKSSARRDRVPKEEEHLWRFIDADDFKKRLVKKLQQSGEYESMIPPAVGERIAAGERFAPGEFASLVHEESSMLARQARLRSLNRGERVVLDGVNGSDRKLREKVEELAKTGYSSVEIIAVDGPKAVTRARVEHRWNKSFDAYLAGDEDAGYDARYVPEHISDAIYREGDERSSCAKAVAKCVRQGPVDDLRVQAFVHIVDRADGAPELWRTYEQREDGRVSVTQRKRDERSEKGASDSHDHDEKSSDLGTPRPQGAGDEAGRGGGARVVTVPGYTKKDGTVVEPYTYTRRG